MKKFNYKVNLAYDGSKFYGWAKQTNLRTIQSEIEQQLAILFNEHITIFGSGRTDKYVHAIDQCFNFKTHHYIPYKSVITFLNSRIEDIQVKKVKLVDEKFSSRFSIIKKTYLYVINCGPYDLFKRNYEYQLNHKLSIKKLNEVKKLFIGTKNFLSFSTSEKQDSIRTIEKITISNKENKVYIKVTGNGFLRNMVRMIVATFISYCENKITIQQINDLFDNPKKGGAINKIDGCGLYLYKTYYPKQHL